MAVVSGGLGLSGFLAACGGSSKTEAIAATTRAAGTTAATAGTSATTRAASATSSAPATTAGGSTPAANGKPFDESLELAVNFSYVLASNAGRIHNPYIAVWLEDTKAVSVRTLTLNINRGREGLRYVQELRRWFRDDQTRLSSGGADLINTISSATRIPGAYSVVWNGRDDKNQLLAQGDYFVCIEAARENGPYEIIREQVTIGAAPFTKQLTNNGELQSAVVELRKRA